jgi:ABC-2 type transport system permease protein
VLPGGNGPWSPLARRQYAALVWVQTRLFVNSLRSMRGSFELGARVLSGLIFSVIALGPAIGMGYGAYIGAEHARRLSIAILLWVLCVVWQFFSAFAPALAGQNPDLTNLLRFPLSFGSWILLFLVCGVITPSTLIGLFWTLGIGVGITAARPDLFLGTALTLALFVAFNVLLSRTILAWIERWMAQRRTREIVTGILLFLALGAQAFNPAFHHYGHGLPFGLQPASLIRLSKRVWAIQEAFPPGLAAESVTAPMRGGGRLLPFAGLGLYSFAVASLLALRLRSESRGESFGEAPRRQPPVKGRSLPTVPAWRAFSGPGPAVFEKDFRYLLRSAPMLYSLAAPLVMAFLFTNTFQLGRLSSFRLAYGLPLGVVWAFMGLTRLANNSLGGEGQGIYLYFLSPTPLRTVMLGKNALHLIVFLLEAAIISAMVILRLGLPAPSIVGATLAWILVAVPLNFAAGNLLSILMPYRTNMTRMGREQGALGNGLLSLLIQFATVAVGALVVLLVSALGHPWLATPALLALSGVSIFVYWNILARLDGITHSHQESLIDVLAKTAPQ